MYFWTYRLLKTWLDKSLRSPVSEDPSSNMVNGPKYCWKLNRSTFTIFIDPCEDNYGRKSLPEWYAKPSHFLLTHWLPLISILFLTKTIYRNIFRCNYLRNKKYFLNFCLHFLNWDSISKFSKKKLPSYLMYFGTYQVRTT